MIDINDKDNENYIDEVKLNLEEKKKFYFNI
jgi:hypothetical protein